MDTLELIHKLWEVMNMEQDSDIAVEQICMILNEVEADIRVEKGHNAG